MKTFHFCGGTEFSEQMGLPVDLSSASRAATQCALREDKLIFYGNDELGYKGLLTEDGLLNSPYRTGAKAKILSKTYQ